MVKVEAIKMLTPTDIKNIEGFQKLPPNHQRVFKHRLIKKCIMSQEDLEFILLNYDKLKIKIDKIIDINQLTKLLELYENLTKLQNM